jgi:hypothetical protein
MKITSILLFVLLLNFSVFSQSKTNLKFSPLITIGTISKATEIAKIQIGNELKEKNFFVKDWVDKTHTLQKALFYKKGSIYTIYKLPNSYDGNGQYSFFELSDNSKFILYTTEYNYGTRGHIEGSSDFNIIDLENLSSLSIKTHLTTESWEDGKQPVLSQCDSEISLKGNMVLVKTKKTKNRSYKEYFEEDCLPSGNYKISAGELIQIK